MLKSLFSIVAILMLATAANANIQVSLSREAQTPKYLTRTVEGKACTKGIVTSVELKSLGENKAAFAKSAVVEIRDIGGFGGRRLLLLARVVFSGNDTGTGLNLSHLIYRNSGVSVPVEVCQNGDIKISASAN